MVGKTVILFLKNPLFAFTTKDEKSSLPSGIVQIKGTIVKDKGPGLWLKVDALGVEGDPMDDLSHHADLPLDEVFIPYAKLDYLIIS